MSAFVMRMRVRKTPGDDHARPDPLLSGSREMGSTGRARMLRPVIPGEAQRTAMRKSLIPATRGNDVSKDGPHGLKRKSTLPL